MATQPIGAESVPVTLPGTIPPAPAVMRILSRFERGELASFISVAIDLLDFVDGDPELEVEDPAGETIPVIDDPEVPPQEDDGDPDLEETDAEDSFVMSNSALHHARGPGCNIADPDKGVDDDGEGIDEREPDDDKHAHLDFAVDQSGGPLPLHQSDDRMLRRPFVERARKSICRPRSFPDFHGRTHIMEEL